MSLSDDLRAAQKSLPGDDKSLIDALISENEAALLRDVSSLLFATAYTGALEVETPCLTFQSLVSAYPGGAFAMGMSDAGQIFLLTKIGEILQAADPSLVTEIRQGKPDESGLGTHFLFVSWAV